ncbi:MAG: DMT family transporter, partial [Armatimonadota bacterium]|nr:DMT family transporter [Armatimonadota bacterium]
AHVAFARFFIGGATLALLLMARGGPSRLAPLLRDPRSFFWPAATGIAGMGVLSAVGAALTTAVNVSLIMNANPVFVALLAPLAGERLTASRVAGALVGLAGVGVVVLSSSDAGPSFVGARDVLGSLAAVGSALGWAVYTLLGKGVVERYGGVTATAGAMIWGAVLLLPFVAAGPLPRGLSGEAAALLFLLGVLPTAFAFALWYRALALVDAAALAPTQYLAPPCTILLAWFLLHERIDAALVLGLLLIFAGIAVATRRPRQGAT